MKKIFGVSLAAMLAVSPMLANAAQSAAALATEGASKATIATVSDAANTNVATTSYVKGAYNAIAGEHNKVVTAVNDIVTDIDVTTDGTTIKAANSVAENLSALDEAIKGISDVQGDYVTHDEGRAVAETGKTLQYVTADGTKVGENLGKLDAQLATVSSTVANYSDDLDAKQNKTDSVVTAEAMTAAGLTDGELNAGQGVGANLIKVASAAKDLKENTTLTAAEVAAHNALTSTTDVAENLIGLAEAIENTNTTAQNFATKEGVVATINKSTASATVPVFGNWGTPDESTANITISSAVTSPATNAYYATVSATSGTTQPEQ